METCHDFVENVAGCAGEIEVVVHTCGSECDSEAHVFAWVFAATGGGAAALIIKQLALPCTISRNQLPSEFPQWLAWAREFSSGEIA